MYVRDHASFDLSARKRILPIFQDKSKVAEMRAKVVERWRRELEGLESLLNDRQSTYFVDNQACAPKGRSLYYVYWRSLLTLFPIPVLLIAGVFETL